MQTLVSLYEEKKDALEKSLREAETPQNALRLMQAEIREFADLEGEYIGGLSVPQARLAKSMFESLRLSMETLLAVKVQETRNHQPLVNQAKSIDASILLRSGVEVVVTGAAGAAGSTIAGPLGAAIGSAVVVAGTRFLNVGVGEAPVTPGSVESSLRVDASALLSLLRQGLEVIDQTVAAHEPEPETVPKKPDWEDHPELLEFLQNLIGDALNEKNQTSSSIQSRMKELSTLLRHQRISAEVYQPGKPQEEAIEKFDFEPALDPNLKEHVTLVPAFVRDGEVLLRGRVVEPAS